MKQFLIDCPSFVTGYEDLFVREINKYNLSIGTSFNSSSVSYSQLIPHNNSDGIQLDILLSCVGCVNTYTI